MAKDHFITLQEAASFLGVSQGTLRNWDKKGYLKAHRNRANNYRVYRVSEVLAVQRSNTLFSASDASDTLDRQREGQPPLTPGDLRRLIRSLHRILRDCDGNSSLIERFDELTKIIYLKVNEERGTNGSQLPLFAVTGDAHESADRVRSAFRRLVAGRPEMFPAKFAELRLTDAAICALSEALAPIHLAMSTEDLKGLAYEDVIRNTFEKGDNQQFFTPHHVVEFMVDMVQEWLKGTICDPAGGTGGFLLSAAKRAKVLGRSIMLRGFEVDERLAWTMRMNLDMHDVTDFAVDFLPGSGSLGLDLERLFDQVDVILTNPPFGSDLSDATSLRRFVLGRGRTSRRRGVLFIERSLSLVKPGGIVAIIIDDGALNGPTNRDARQLILETSHPFAVVSLPETAFMPYASVKASILFLRKLRGRKLLTRQEPTFFAEAEVVGRKPNGDPLLRVNPATGKLELHSDLPAIHSFWTSSRTRSAAPIESNGAHAFWTDIPPVTDPTFHHDGFRLDIAYHHPSRNSAARILQKCSYPLRPLAEICDVRNDSVMPSQDLLDEEIPFVGLANIQAHTGICNPVIISATTLKSSVKHFVSGDILFARMRPELRKVCLVPDSLDEGYASGECLVLTPKVDANTKRPVMIPELLAILLRSDLVYGQIVHMITGIGRPRVTSAVTLNVKLPLAAIDEQKRLLDLYHRSQAAAQLLQAEADKGMRQAGMLLENARTQLVADLLGSHTE